MILHYPASYTPIEPKDGDCTEGALFLRTTKRKVSHILRQCIGGEAFDFKCYGYEEYAVRLFLEVWRPLFQSKIWLGAYLSRTAKECSKKMLVHDIFKIWRRYLASFEDYEEKQAQEETYETFVGPAFDATPVGDFSWVACQLLVHTVGLTHGSDEAERVRKLCACLATLIKFTNCGQPRIRQSWHRQGLPESWEQLGQILHLVDGETTPAARALQVLLRTGCHMETLLERTYADSYGEDGLNIPVPAHLRNTAKWKGRTLWILPEQWLKSFADDNYDGNFYLFPAGEGELDQADIEADIAKTLRERHNSMDEGLDGGLDEEFIRAGCETGHLRPQALEAEFARLTSSMPGLQLRPTIAFVSDLASSMGAVPVWPDLERIVDGRWVIDAESHMQAQEHWEFFANCLDALTHAAAKNA